MQLNSKQDQKQNIHKNINKTNILIKLHIFKISHLMKKIGSFNFTTPCLYMYTFVKAGETWKNNVISFYMQIKVGGRSSGESILNKKKK